MRKVVSEKKEVVKTECVILEESIICNKCGKEFIRVEDNYCWNAEIHSIQIEFGYGSQYDLERWSFDLCEDCLTEFIKTFKYVPDGFMQLTGMYPLEKDHQLVFERWKETGKWEPFTNYTIKEIEKFRGIIHDEYLNEVIEKCKIGELEYKKEEGIKR